MLVSSGMAVLLAQYMTSGIEWGHVICVCLGSYLSVRGQGGGGDCNGLSRMLSRCYIQQTNISHLSQHC